MCALDACADSSGSGGATGEHTPRGSAVMGMRCSEPAWGTRLNCLRLLLRQSPGCGVPEQKSGPWRAVSASSTALLRVVHPLRGRAFQAVLPSAERSDDVRHAGDQSLRSAVDPEVRPSSPSVGLTEHLHIPPYVRNRQEGKKTKSAEACGFPEKMAVSMPAIRPPDGRTGSNWFSLLAAEAPMPGSGRVNAGPSTRHPLPDQRNSAGVVLIPGTPLRDKSRAPVRSKREPPNEPQ